MFSYGPFLKSFKGPVRAGYVLKAFFLFAVFFLLGSGRVHAQFTVGQSIYFYDTFSNTGSVTQSSITISAPVAADLTYNSCAGAPCSNNGGTVIWTVASLLPGQSVAVTYFATISSCAQTLVTDQATVSIGSPQTVVQGTPLSFTVNCLTDTPTASPTPTQTGTPTFTPTVTFTPTITNTPTITFTPTVTSTPTITPTPVPTFDVFYVNQNQFNPANGPVSINVQYSQYPGNYAVWIYNSAGEHVRTLDSQTLNGPVTQWYLWDGKNKYGADCASGVYLIYLEEPFDRKQKRILLIR